VIKNKFIFKEIFKEGKLVTLVLEWEMSSRFSPWMQRNYKTVPKCRLC